MGNINNNHSNIGSSTYGNIYLRTERLDYSGGETVSGEIYLCINSSYPGSSIYLRLRGREYCVYNKKDSMDVSNNNKKHLGSRHKNLIRGEKEILNNRLEVYRYECGVVEVG